MQRFSGMRAAVQYISVQYGDSQNCIAIQQTNVWDSQNTPSLLNRECSRELTRDGVSSLKDDSTEQIEDRAEGYIGPFVATDWLGQKTDFRRHGDTPPETEL